MTFKLPPEDDELCSGNGFYQKRRILAFEPQLTNAITLRMVNLGIPVATEVLQLCRSGLILWADALGIINFLFVQVAHNIM